jgi:hypothetical protein
MAADERCAAQAADPVAQLGRCRQLDVSRSLDVE